MTSAPPVTVVMAVRNEARHLRAAVASALAQDYPGSLDVVVAVGPSTDDTMRLAAELAHADARVHVVQNPTGTTPAGLNAAIAAAAGEVIVRVDGHSELPDGYVRRAVELLQETGADNVGGIMAAKGETVFEQAVAAAMSSRFGTGDARFHYGGAPGPVDTVYLGVFSRSALDRVGGYDETFLRTQDAELNHRIRATGGLVYFSPDLWVTYRPRGTFGGLARQYFEYGRWRRVMVRRHPGSLRWRQLVAPATMVASAGGVGLTATGRRAGLVPPGAYAVGLAAASAIVGRNRGWGVTWRLPAVFATMHMAWALGFLTSPRALGKPVTGPRALGTPVTRARAGRAR